jgi:hypothetical protein
MQLDLYLWKGTVSRLLRFQLCMFSQAAEVGEKRRSSGGIYVLQTNYKA